MRIKTRQLIKYKNKTNYTLWWLHGKQSTRLLSSLFQIFSRSFGVVNGKKQIQFMQKGYQIDCFRTQWKLLVSIQSRWRIGIPFYHYLAHRPLFFSFSLSCKFGHISLPQFWDKDKTQRLWAFDYHGDCKRNFCLINRHTRTTTPLSTI